MSLKSVEQSHSTSERMGTILTFNPYDLFLLSLGLNELVPDNLLTMFSEQELEVSIFLVMKHAYKGLFKRSQHVGPTSPNIVGCNMLASFEHNVGRCWLDFKLA